MNSFERTFLRIANKVEHALSGVWSRDRRPRRIEPYIGYATRTHFIVKGRVHAHLRQIDARYSQSRLRNVRQMLQRFMTAEVADARVSCNGVATHSDEEGYFELAVERDGRSGWVILNVQLHDAAGGVVDERPCEVFAPSDPDVLVISDIDDTVMKTGAYSLTRNLWTSFTGNTLTRQVFADSAVLMDRLAHDQKMPIFYVSSSPWNLHGFLRDIFARAALVKGPMFLRDLGLSETKLITEGHGDHKGAAIDTILAANPHSRAILIGDTGQKDAYVYHDAIHRHPTRIAAVVLREPGPDLDLRDRKAIDALKATKVPTFHAPTFAGLAEQLTDQITRKAAHLARVG